MDPDWEGLLWDPRSTLTKQDWSEGQHQETRLGFQGLQKYLHAARVRIWSWNRVENYIMILYMFTRMCLRNWIYIQNYFIIPCRLCSSRNTNPCCRDRWMIQKTMWNVPFLPSCRTTPWSTNPSQSSDQSILLGRRIHTPPNIISSWLSMATRRNKGCWRTTTSSWIGISWWSNSRLSMQATSPSQLNLRLLSPNSSRWRRPSLKLNLNKKWMIRITNDVDYSWLKITASSIPYNTASIGRW